LHLQVPRGSPLLRIGPAGWAYTDWAGYVYPQPRPKNFHPATFLAEYFDTIEINTSFIIRCRPITLRKWIERGERESTFYLRETVEEIHA
jgi:uncharacterized protein YecE (DUF72 family)